MRCPNCGSSNLLDLCECTWDEIGKAMDIKEKQRRKHLEKIGEPVIVDRFKREQSFRSGK